MKRSTRLTRNEDIKHVRKDGQSLTHKALVLCFLSNRLNKNRIAIIAGRSVGGAVQRNLAKRRIRSAFHYLQEELCQGYDLIIIARKSALEINYSLLLDALRSLIEKAGLLRETVH